MVAITWRNVDAPNLGDPSRSLAYATHTFNNAFEGLSKTLQEREATDKANWQATKDFNTNQFLSQLTQFNTPEEAAAAKAGLMEQLVSKGAQIDGTAARTALAGLEETLQKRQMANQQYQDQQTEVKNRPYVSGFAQEIAAAKTQEDLDRFKQGVATYQNQGYLDPVAAAKLVDQAVNRNRTLVGDQQTADKVKSDLLTAESTRTHQANQDRIAQARLGVDKSQAEVQRLQAVANIMLNSTGKGTDIAKQSDDETKVVQAAQDASKKGSPFEGGTHSKVKESAYFDLGKQIGLNKEDVASFLSYASKDERFKRGTIKVAGTSEEIPITSGMVRDAMLQAKDTFLKVGWLPWNDNGDVIMSRFDEIAKDPTLIDQYKTYLEKQKLYEDQKVDIKQKAESRVNNLKAKTDQVLNALGGGFSVGEPPKKVK